MSQAGMKTRLRQLRALLSLTDNEYLSELSELYQSVYVIRTCIVISVQA